MEVVESALFCLSAVGREACARVKSMRNIVSSGRDSPVAADGEATKVVGSICPQQGGYRTVPPLSLFLTGVTTFLFPLAASCGPS